MQIKKELASIIDFNIEGADFESLIMDSVSSDKGDYCLPCFSFAKALHKSPVQIAEDIQKTLKPNKLIEKTEVVGGYLNFFLNKAEISKQILQDFSGDFSWSEGKGKTVLIDYASPNLAKYLHIGHLKTTIIGESLARLFTLAGYNVKRLNYIGDYGTPFGKIIGGLKKWGSVEDVKARGNDALQEYYVKFNQAEAEDESCTQLARDIFKKIEDKDPEIYSLYKFIIEIAFDDAKNLLHVLGADFDDYRGENYYNQFVPKIIEELKQKNLLKTSQGAQIVDLEPYNLTPAVVLKSDGTSLYTTRDICAVKERYKEYNFDKMLYVTDVAQTLNFKQLFKIMELMGAPFYDKMEHIAYGRFSLPDGKISSRRGKQAVLVDLMDYALDKAKDVIKDRHFEIEKPEDVANKVMRSVINYSVLKVERAKDCVFEMEKAFSFEGETAPYMQYTFTRLESILRKYNGKTKQADFGEFNQEMFDLVKMVNDFPRVLKLALDKREISLIANRIMEMCKAFNKCYANTKILGEDNSSTKAKVMLIKALRDTLKTGFNLICIDTLKEM